MTRTSARVRSILAVVAAAVLGASLTAAPAAATQHPSPPPAPVVDVQTYNMNFGADLAPLFAPGANPLLAATAIWNEMQASKIPERAQAVAALLAARQPDLVGLQEVSIWRSAPATFTPPATFAPAGPFVTNYDALALLLADLKALGTPYRAVVVGTNFTNETFPLPFIADPRSPMAFGLATFTDQDVILVRSASLRHRDLSIRATASHTYSTLLTVSVAGQQITVPRGYVTADVRMHGRTFRFASTHLEAYGDLPLKDQIRNPQSVELAAALTHSPYPVVLVGDINARPTMCANYRPGTPEYAEDQNVVAYRNLTQSGLREVWPIVHRHNPCSPAGWTSGQSTLDNAASTLTHRIDDVFVSRSIKVLDAHVVGNRQSDRTPSGLWPSDHASTWASVRLNGSMHH